MTFFKAFGLVVALVAVTPAFASEPQSCRTVRFAEPGWTDIAATTAVTTTVLEALGYKTSTKLLSVSITYAALSKRNIDVFLGYWSPSMAADYRPYEKAGTVDTVRVNLTGAKYTLAVPQFAYDAGLKTFDDIARFGDALEGRIYGVEAGNDGNRLILTMLKDNAFNLGGFKLIESSERVMLSQVESRISAQKPIVFLGWEPHPMNRQIKMAYLSGGDKYFGANFGAATVSTHVRKGYMNECQNVGQLLKNLEFSLDMENELMGKILDKKAKPADVAREWLKLHPDVLEKWLAGVTTVDGGNALGAVKSALE